MNYSTLALNLSHDIDGVLIDVGSLYARLGELLDPRKRRGVRYRQAVILVAMLLAKLAGQDSPQGIAEWVRLRKELFKELFAVRRANMPHAAMYRRVARLEQLSREFLLSAPGAGNSQQVTLDGKKIRGVLPTSTGRGTHLLAVYLPAQGVVLYQMAIENKNNEIPAAWQALKHLNLREKIATADALHTQREISVAVVDAGTDYVWAAKDNQPTLHREIAQLFQPETCLPGISPVITNLRVGETTEKNRGQIETRRLTTSSLLAETSNWPHLAQVFKLERSVHHLQTNASHTEVVYGLTSLTADRADPQRLLALVRGHWAIESQLHWRREVLLHEGQTHTKSAPIGQTLACLNNLLMSLVRRLGWINLAQARRHFDAHLDHALRALLTPLT